MNNPITPNFVYVIYKDNERELERRIEMIRTAKERGTYEEVSVFDQIRAWYTQASLWANANLFSRLSNSKRASSQAEMFQEPCPTVPC